MLQSIVQSPFFEKLAERADRNITLKWERHISLLTECTLLQETILLLLRDWKKYQRITAAMLIGDMTGIATGIRSAYAFCRLVDDRVDGDRRMVADLDTIEWLHMLQDHISILQSAHDSWRNSIKVRNETATEDILLAEMLHRIGGHDKREITQCLTTYLDSAVVDYRRRIGAVVHSEAELSHIYSQSFEPVQDIAFMSLRSRTRSKDIPQLSQLQGRAYAVRDLHTEFPRGEINVPSEVLATTDKSIQEIQQTDPFSIPEIRQWAATEISFCIDTIDQIKNSPVRDSGEKWVRRILLPPIQKIITTRMPQA